MVDVLSFDAQSSHDWSRTSGENDGHACGFSRKAAENHARLPEAAGKAAARKAMDGLLPDVAPDVTRRIVAFLARRHPVKTASHVEAATGIPADSYHKWEAERANPSAPNLLKLVGAYGPPLLAACFERAPAWLDEARVAMRKRELEVLIARASRELADLDDGFAAGRVAR